MRHRRLIEVQTNAIANVKRSILNVLNHEFRTPLTYIVAYADMLNQSGQLSADEMISFLHGVNSGALRLRRLVENFIQLVEIETGETARTYYSRRARIENVEEIFRLALRQVATHLIDRKMNPIEIDIAPDLPPFIADAEYLRLMLVQLVDNAVKFSPPDRPIRFRAFAQDSYVYLAVSDEGRGISPEEQEKIWDMFYQINRPYYEDQGTGSGLAIVRGMMHIHGGHAHLESVEGRGSTFTLVLPLVPPPAPSINGSGA